VPGRKTGFRFNAPACQAFPDLPGSLHQVYLAFLTSQQGERAETGQLPDLYLWSWMLTLPELLLRGTWQEMQSGPFPETRVCPGSS
jgi:hypothetical protein